MVCSAWGAVSVMTAMAKSCAADYDRGRRKLAGSGCDLGEGAGYDVTPRGAVRPEKLLV